MPMRTTIPRTFDRSNQTRHRRSVLDPWPCWRRIFLFLKTPDRDRPLKQRPSIVPSKYMLNAVTTNIVTIPISSFFLMSAFVLPVSYQDKGSLLRDNIPFPPFALSDILGFVYAIWLNANMLDGIS